MPVSVFTLIHQNQTLISCGIAITISICTFVATILTVDEVKDAEMYAGYVIYKKGLQDGILKTPKESPQQVWNDDLVQLHSQLAMVRKITTALGFLVSFLHLTSSIWTIYKKSKMSIQVWLVVQAVTLAALLAALLLPMTYEFQSVFMLKLFYAVTSVDIFLTLVLLLVVLIDLRSSSQESSVDEEKSNNGDDNPEEKSMTVHSAVAEKDEPLPSPPPTPASE